jgi:exodeoxyribonuclease VIII
MVDLETMGTSPNAAIIAIGAVKFDVSSGEISGDSFYRRIDLESSMKCGGEVSASTIMWWLAQSAKAQAEILKETPGRVHIKQALRDFAEWYGNCPIPIWGDGAASDNVWLKSAYARLGMECPWTYKQDRCLRTMKELRPQVEVPIVGVEHRALDDAIYQARLLMAILETLPKDHGFH